MIVDGSAILAVLYLQPDREWFADRLARPERKRMSAGSFLECAIKFDRSAPQLPLELDRFIEEHLVEIAPVTPAQARLARLAYQRYGKGVHPAGLNFGDCFAYALAQDTGEPLLFKGADFSQTDLQPVP